MCLEKMQMRDLSTFSSIYCQGLIHLGQNTIINTAFTVSDETFGLLVLHNKLEIWNQQFEAKQNDTNAKISCGPPEYQKKYIEPYPRNIYQDGQLRVKQFIIPSTTD